MQQTGIIPFKFTIMNWKDRYYAAREQWYAKEYPQSYKDGYYYNSKMPPVSKANGLANMILNFCKWMGHDMERNNTTGRYRQGQKHKTDIYAGGYIQEKGTWIKSEKAKGGADLKGSIKGRAVQIEIKVGKDRPSDDQLKRQEIARADGAVYEFVSTPEEFFKLYDEIVG